MQMYSGLMVRDWIGAPLRRELSAMTARITLDCGCHIRFC